MSRNESDEPNAEEPEREADGNAGAEETDEPNAEEPEREADGNAGAEETGGDRPESESTQDGDDTPKESNNND